MKKMTTAYQLDRITEPVTIALNPADKKWYPIDGIYKDNEHGIYKDNELFIMGKGRVKINKWKKETLNPLPELKAEFLKPIYDQYGLNVAMGMINGWGGSSLYHDNSYGLNGTKYEVINMALLGKQYDDFTDKVQVIGDNFIQGLCSNGFMIQGTMEKGSLWYDYKDENNFGSLVGSVGIYERVKLHPLQHIEHVLGIAVIGCRSLPQFDPISFDSLLVKLLMSRYYKDNEEGNSGYEKADKMLNEIVSVKDRIAHLSSQKSADEIESIFNLQKELTLQ